MRVFLTDKIDNKKKVFLVPKLIKIEVLSSDSRFFFITN